jgi:insertion element IS1 protein InsB
VHQPLLTALPPDEVNVVIQRVDAAEVDAMGSYVEKKTAPRWWWHALDHQTGKVLADVFGRRQDQMFLQLKGLLEPCGIRRYDSGGRVGCPTARGSRMQAVEKAV